MAEHNAETSAEEPVLGTTDSSAEPAEAVEACAVHPAPPPMDRRSFLVALAGASIGASALLAGATVVQAISPPDRSIDGKTKVGALAVGKAGDLQVGKPVLVDYGDDTLYLVKVAENTIKVYDAACPHVRCKLAWNPDKKQFDCPCHASSFDINGKKLGGPAPRDMYVAYFTVKDGSVVVTGLEG